MAEFEGSPPQFLPMPGLEAVIQVLKINEAIVKQNTLIIQALSLPQLIVKTPDSTENK